MGRDVSFIAGKRILVNNKLSGGFPMVLDLKWRRSSELVDNKERTCNTPRVPTQDCSRLRREFHIRGLNRRNQVVHAQC